jgi:hypothetical protein
MEMDVMMAMWVAEMERLHKKVGERTLTEQFFVELTLEIDDVHNAGDRREYRSWLLTQMELYLSGQPDQAMANVLTAAGKAERKAAGGRATGNA